MMSATDVLAILIDDKPGGLDRLTQLLSRRISMSTTPMAFSGKPGEAVL